MTQEEKAKAYDKALEKARKLYNDAKANEYKSDMEDYESIFPELAESEDERIRKALIEVFKKKLEKGFEWVEYGIPNRSVLDWLEKQKDSVSNAKYIEDVAHAFEDGRKKGIEEEQKPAEWSEEDEKDMAHIIRILDDCYVYGTHDLSKTDRENLVNKLKSLRPSWKPSEEQMEALHRCVDYLEESDNEDAEFMESLLEQLKKL